MEPLPAAIDDDDLEIELDSATAVRWRAVLDQVVGSSSGYAKLRDAAAVQVEKMYAYLPPNWPRGRTARILDLALTDRLPIAWVPSEQVLIQMTDLTDRGQRVQVLIDELGHVCGHAQTVIDGITEGSFVFVAETLREAVTLLSTGHPRAAQALAAVVLDELFERRLQRRWADKTGEELKQFETRPEELTVAELHDFTTFAAMFGVLDHFPKGPIPRRFNRHATVHAHGPIQYTQENAIVGVLFAISLAREMVHDPAIVRPDPYEAW